MYATVRRYTGDPGLADKFAARRKDIEALMHTTPGFISYYMMKTIDGAVTVTVCDDKAGADRSNQLAADWIKENMPGVVTKSPEIYPGEVVITTTTQTTGTRT